MELIFRLILVVKIRKFLLPEFKLFLIHLYFPSIKILSQWGLKTNLKMTYFRITPHYRTGTPSRSSSPRPPRPRLATHYSHYRGGLFPELITKTLQPPYGNPVSCSSQLLDQALFFGSGAANPVGCRRSMALLTLPGLRLISSNM